MGPQKARVRMGYGPFPGGELTRHTPCTFYEKVVLGPDRYRWGPKRPAYVWVTAFFQEASSRDTRPTSYTGEVHLAQMGVDGAPQGPRTYGLRPFFQGVS